jgi:hypothetical protein
MKSKYKAVKLDGKAVKLNGKDMTFITKTLTSIYGIYIFCTETIIY